MYYEGKLYSSDLESILEGHKRSIITFYGTRTSSNLASTDPEKTGAVNNGKVLSCTAVLGCSGVSIKYTG